MRRINIYIIVTILLAIIALLAYQYIFTIYEVTFSVEPKELFTDNQSTVTIAVVPLNAFGWEAPFRSSSAEFKITEGKNLIEVISVNNENGVLIIKAKSLPGKVVILIKSKNALLPSPVEIPVHPNIAGK
ncbi:MAG: hypothetical protein R6W90_11255 [Ignavibacteriaceae bacterium]